MAKGRDRGVERRNHAQQAQGLNDYPTSLQGRNLALRMEVWLLQQLREAERLELNELEDVDREYYSAIGQTCQCVLSRVKDVKDLKGFDGFIEYLNVCLSALQGLVITTQEQRARVRGAHYMERLALEKAHSLRGELDE